MAILTDEKLLRTPSEAVKDYAEGKWIGEELIKEVMKIGGSTKALGLSAPQIGIFKRVFITWGSTGESRTEGWNVYINPTFEEPCSDERMFYEEGCLSFPYASVRTNRNSQILVSTVEEDGERHKYVLYGDDAIVFQHELDHLDGILMFDRVAKSVPQSANTGKNKIERNEPCPCGSGKKYKKCCGR
jgi:peptide deformylase